MAVTGSTGMAVGSLVYLASSSSIALASRSALGTGPTHVILEETATGEYLIADYGNVDVLVTGGVVSVPSRLQLSGTPGSAEVSGTAIEAGGFAFGLGVALETTGGDGLVLCRVQIDTLPWMRW